MYSQNGTSGLNAQSGMERVSPPPYGWNQEDPIGEELMGHRNRSPGLYGNRNKPVPPSVVNHADNPQGEYGDNTDDQPIETYYIGETSQGLSHNTPKTSNRNTLPPPKLRHNTTDDGAIIKKVVIDLELNIKISVV